MDTVVSAISFGQVIDRGARRRLERADGLGAGGLDAGSHARAAPLPEPARAGHQLERHASGVRLPIGWG